MLTPMLLSRIIRLRSFAPVACLSSFGIIGDAIRQQSEVSGSCRQHAFGFSERHPRFLAGMLRLVSACGAAFSMLNPSKI